MSYTNGLDDPSAYFHTQLYTGTGSSGLAITNDANAGDFQPDWLWIKPRSVADNNVVFDSSRGSDKQLKTNGTDAEDTHSPARVTFETDGFDLDTTDGNYNGNGTTYVAWQWKANGGTEVSVSASGSGITDILASSHQANTTAGFSIVKWTGDNSEAYVSHGLGAVPHCYIVKNRDTGTTNWMMYHKDTGGDAGMILNTTAARDVSSFWRDSDAVNTGDPTSSIFKLGTQAYTGGNTDAMIAYCWTPIQGYSKFGSYTGNGNADGPFVYTGFKPAWLMIKRTDATAEWHIWDNKREDYNGNPNNTASRANNSNAESDSTDYSIDFLSNGFKVRNASNLDNASSSTQVYMAFAEHPFVSSEGVPATAR